MNEAETRAELIDPAIRAAFDARSSPSAACKAQVPEQSRTSPTMSSSTKTRNSR